MPKKGIRVRYNAGFMIEGRMIMKGGYKTYGGARRHIAHMNGLSNRYRNWFVERVTTWFEEGKVMFGASCVIIAQERNTIVHNVFVKVG